MLDKYNVFNFGNEIARIVRTATLEEELDCLVKELEKTWTEQRLDTKIKHGIPAISDFNSLYKVYIFSMK